MANGRQSWLKAMAVGFAVFPPHFCEAAMLEERVSGHRQERVTTKTLQDLRFEVARG